MRTRQPLTEGAIIRLDPGLYPMPAGSRSGDRFLMVANHEYTNANLMFPGLGAGRSAALKATREQVAVEMASGPASPIGTPPADAAVRTHRGVVPPEPGVPVRVTVPIWPPASCPPAFR